MRRIRFASSSGMTARFVALAGALSLVGIAACSGDDSGATPPAGDDSGSTSNPDGGSTTTDSGSGGDSTTTNPDSGQKVDSGTQSDTGTPQSDTGTGSETGSGTDSGDASDGAAAKSFCQSQAGLDFCNDFDLPNPLSSDPDAGANAWSAVVGSAAEVATSTVQAKSQPNSVLISLPLGSVNGDRSAKVVKMITPSAGVAQAIYEFDLYIDHVPANGAGGFATDFQFSDTSAGSDRFGFRIGLFSKAVDGGVVFDHADVEHNHPDLGGGDDIISPINITAGAWNHVKMVVAYGAGADGGNEVAFQLFLNGATTADVNATYPAPFAKAPFARFAAGMVFAFDGQNKDWGLYYDNFTLKLQ